MKYSIFWMISFCATLLFMIILMKAFTNVGYSNIRGEDLLILGYLSFCAIATSIATATKYLSDLNPEEERTSFI